MRGVNRVYATTGPSQSDNVWMETQRGGCTSSEVNQKVGIDRLPGQASVHRDNIYDGASKTGH